MEMERGNRRRNLGAISIVVPRSRAVMQTVADQHYWGAGVWGVITVKNKCLIMTSTISITALRYAIVLLQYDGIIVGSNYCPN